MVLVGLLKQLPAWDYINPKPYALNKEGAAARGGFRIWGLMF